MALRQWLHLIGITIGVFIFNMSEFMPIGLLTDIASDFGISESTAGLIISTYAWTVAILSLPIMLLLKKMEYRRMLLMCVAMFAGFQFLSGISGSYWMLMVSRLGVAVSHSIFWSIASPLAVRVVAPEHHKLAISAIAAGTSIAMIVGLPLGRVSGLSLGWRMTFIVIAIVAIMTLVLLVAVFPRLENPGTFTVKRLPELFRNKVLFGIYILVAVFVTGYYTGYSYIEPFLGQISGMSDNMITIALTIFGIAGIGGSILFTKIYDRTRYRFIMMAIGGTALSLLMLKAFAGSVMLMIVLCAFWGVFVTSFNVAFQNEAIRASPPDATAISMSLYTGIFNVGIAAGSMIGGFVTESSSVDCIGYVGGALVIVSLIFTGLYLIRRMKETDLEKSVTGPSIR